MIGAWKRCELEIRLANVSGWQKKNGVRWWMQVRPRPWELLAEDKDEEELVGCREQRIMLDAEEE